MKTFKKISILTLFSIFLLLPAKRADAIASFSIMNFQANGILAVIAGGNSFSGQIAWTPYIGLGPIGVRGDFGVTLLKNSLDDRFLVTNYEALACLSLLPALSVEGGLGFHTWHSNGGTNPAMTLNLVLNLIGIDRVFVGFSRVFMSSGVNEFRAGIGFTL